MLKHIKRGGDIGRMTREEAEMKYIKIEWSDGIVESIYVPFGVSSITIDITAKKEWGIIK